MATKDDAARGRVDVITTTMKRAASGVAVVARPLKKGGSIFTTYALPSGTVRTIDKAALDRAIEKSDLMIRAKSEELKRKSK